MAQALRYTPDRRVCGHRTRRHADDQRHRRASTGPTPGNVARVKQASCDLERIRRSSMRWLTTMCSACITGGTPIRWSWISRAIGVDYKSKPTGCTIRAIPHIKETLTIDGVANHSFRCGPAGRIAAHSFGRKGAPFHHFDLYAQTLAKVERPHRLYLEDSYSGRSAARSDAASAERDPAVDPKSFRARWGRCSDPRRLRDSIVRFRIPIWQCRA